MSIALTTVFSTAIGGRLRDIADLPRLRFNDAPLVNAPGALRAPAHHSQHVSPHVERRNHHAARPFDLAGHVRQAQLQSEDIGVGKQEDHAAGTHDIWGQSTAALAAASEMSVHCSE